MTYSSASHRPIRRSPTLPCAKLSALYGNVKAEARPTSFAGYKLTPGADGAINLSMPQKIEEAAKEHLPELLDNSSAEAMPTFTDKHRRQLIKKGGQGPLSSLFLI